MICIICIYVSEANNNSEAGDRGRVGGVYIYLYIDIDIWIYRYRYNLYI